MQVRTAKGFPGNMAPAMTSLRNCIPTCMFAIPQRIPFGKVKIHEMTQITMKPLKKLDKQNIIRMGMILTTMGVACRPRKADPEPGRRRLQEVLHTTSEELGEDDP